MDALKIAKLYSDQQAQAQTKKAALTEQRNDRQTAHTAIYGGYDADTGLHQVSLEDGSQAWGDFLSNGGVKKGQAIAFNRAHGAQYGSLKAMPR